MDRVRWNLMLKWVLIIGIITQTMPLAAHAVQAILISPHRFVAALQTFQEMPQGSFNALVGAGCHPIR